MTPNVPESPQRSTKPQRRLSLPLLHRPGKRRSEVGVLVIQLVQPRHLRARDEPRLGLFRKLKEVFGMVSPNGIRLLALPESLTGVLADGLEHYEARLTTRPFLLPQEALVYKRGYSFQCIWEVF